MKFDDQSQELIRNEIAYRKMLDESGYLEKVLPNPHKQRVLNLNDKIQIPIVEDAVIWLS